MTAVCEGDIVGYQGTEVAVRYGKLMNLGQENKTHRLPNAP